MGKLKAFFEEKQTYEYASSSWKAFWINRLLALYALVWRVAVLILILLAITAPVQMLLRR